MAAGQSSADFAQHAKAAQSAIQANDSVKAELELNAMLRIDPGNVDAHANLGMLKFVEANYSEAASHFEAALKHSPSLWSAQAFLGLCEAHLANPVKGQKLLEDSLPHVTDATLRKRATLELARLYSNAGTLEKAGPILESLADAAPKDPEVLYAKYRLHSDMAAEALRSLLNAGDSAWLHEVYGQSFMAREQYASAIAEFQKALELGPQLSGLHYQLGEAILSSERSEAKQRAAEKEFRLELAGDPQNADCLLKLGEIALDRSQIDDAQSFIARALRANPASAAAHLDQARVLELQGNAQQAIAELETAEKLAPDLKQTHYRLGTLYRQQGRTSEANQQFEIFQRLTAAQRNNPQPY